MVLGVVLISGGFVLGFLIGRWWALVGPIAAGIYVYEKATASRFGHSDIPWGIVAFAYGFWSAVGVVGGLITRRLIRYFANPS
jgi:hypothetical protein